MNPTVKPKGKKEMRCCIDLGSSYFRKLAVDVENGPDGPSFRNPVQERVYIGWGEEVEHNGTISKETAESAAEILRRLTGDMTGRAGVHLTVVATNALRVASNRDEVREYLEDIAGVEINILSERGEALLGFAGATSELTNGTPVILVDLGGTSTELSWGSAPAGSAFVSLPLGTHSYLDPGAVSELIADIFPASGIPVGDSRLPGSRESHTIMVTGGTAVSLAVAWKQMIGEKYDDAVSIGISADEFERLYEWIDAFYLSGAEQELALPLERIKLFLPGMKMLKEFFRALQADGMTITARDLRWGVVLGDGITEWGYLADEQESPDSR